jgi:hypothetical protein
MSKRRHNRRPQGHPAKTTRARGGDDVRRSSKGGASDKLARSIIREANELTGPLDAELWGSSMLGLFWSMRDALSLEEVGSDPAVTFGGPVIEAMRRIGGAGARVSLAVIETVDEGELGLRAGKIRAALPDEPDQTPPAWVAELGEAAVTEAAVMYEDVFDDGCTVFLEAEHPCGETHTVGVLIDNNLGGMAVDVLLADSIDLVSEIVREHPPPHGDIKLERIALGVAAGRIHAAIELTDMTWDPPVSEDYADLRALALRRADEVPGYVVPAEPSEIPAAARDELMDEFLNSLEGAGFAPDTEEAYAVSLAIGFCADYVDGRPLRWSPTVVELFMADWIPRKVLGDAELFARLPTALDAWVRFAGRKSSLPEWAIAATRKAIPQWHKTMVGRSEDPASAGPAKQFIAAARAAGIDLEDQDALNTFVAGWNARSVVS